MFLLEQAVKAKKAAGQQFVFQFIDSHGCLREEACAQEAHHRLTRPAVTSNVKQANHGAHQGGS